MKVQFEGREFEVPDRDNQRGRLYRAEVQLELDERFPTEVLDEAEARRLLKRVRGSKTWSKLRERHGFPDGGPDLRLEITRAGGGGTAWPGTGLIQVSRTATRPGMLIHEAAHVLVGVGVGHHWPFVRAYGDLLARFVGAWARRGLYDACREEGVRYRRPRPPMSDAERERLSELGKRNLGLS